MNILSKLKPNINPIIELAQLTQRQFGDNIQTKVTSVSGSGHSPLVKIEIRLPDGRIFKAEGANKIEAKQKAAKQALKEFFKTNGKN